MPDTATVDKIKLPDGTLVDLSNSITLNIPSLAKVLLSPEFPNFTGSVDLISGTTDKYLLTIYLPPTISQDASSKILSIS